MCVQGQNDYLSYSEWSVVCKKSAPMFGRGTTILMKKILRKLMLILGVHQMCTTFIIINDQQHSHLYMRNKEKVLSKKEGTF